MNKADLKIFSRSKIVEGQISEEISPEDHNQVNDKIIEELLGKDDDLATSSDFTTIVSTLKKYVNPYLIDLFFLKKSSKATASDVTAGTNDDKYVTAKSLRDAGIEPGGGTGSQTLEEVLTEGNDAGGNQLKNIGDATDDQDAVPFGQLADLVAALTPIKHIEYDFTFNGTETEKTITHNLHTKKVDVLVIETATGEKIFPTVIVTTTTARIVFAVAPPSGYEIEGFYQGLLHSGGGGGSGFPYTFPFTLA